MTDTRIVPLELLQDLRDLASDAVEHHRPFASHKSGRQERMDRVIRAVDKLLAAAPSTPAAQGAVPEGYALVPVEPTPAILDAIDLLCDDSRAFDDSHAFWSFLLAAAPQAEHHGIGYPPCDYCGATLDYEAWHGSGILDGVDQRHIHACDSCRHLLPAAHDQGEVQRLQIALRLSANRFDRLALEFPYASDMRWTASEWADEARSAIAASTGKEAKAAPMSERVAFEAYCQSIGFTLKTRDSGDYVYGYGAELWCGFKAGFKAGFAAAPSAHDKQIGGE